MAGNAGKWLHGRVKEFQGAVGHADLDFSVNLINEPLYGPIRT
jgi:hypothetical protein